MKIQGLQKFSTLDYPDHLCCVIFTGGCNFRCPYCHNPEMITPDLDTPLLDLDEILEFLKNRQGKLEAVCITGGEPSIHADLPDLIKSIRELGFKVKLDTNGTNPDMLAKLYAENLLDYVAMDMKYPVARYTELTTYPDTDRIQKSIKIIMDSGVDYEFRSTIMPRLHTAEEIHAMGKDVQGAK